MFSLKINKTQEKRLLDTSTLVGIFNATQKLIIEQPEQINQMREGIIQQLARTTPLYKQLSQNPISLDEARTKLNAVKQAISSKLTQQEVLYIILEFNKLIYAETGKMPDSEMLEKLNLYLNKTPGKTNQSYQNNILQYHQNYIERNQFLNEVMRQEKTALLPENLKNLTDHPGIFSFFISKEDLHGLIQKDEKVREELESEPPAPTNRFEYNALQDPKLQVAIEKIRIKLHDNFLSAKVFHQKAGAKFEKIFMEALTQKLILHILNTNPEESHYNKLLSLNNPSGLASLTLEANRASAEIKANLESLLKHTDLVKESNEFFIFNKKGHVLNNSNYLVTADGTDRMALKSWKHIGNIKQFLSGMRSLYANLKALKNRSDRYQLAFEQFSRLEKMDSFQLLNFFIEHPDLKQNFLDLKKESLTDANQSKLINLLEKTDKRLEGQRVEIEMENATSKEMTAEDLNAISNMVHLEENKKQSEQSRQTKLNFLFYISIKKIFGPLWQDKKKSIELKNIYNMTWGKESYVFYHYKDKDSKQGTKGIYLELIPVNNNPRLNQMRRLELSQLLTQERIKSMVKDQKTKHPHKSEEEILIELLIQPAIIKKYFQRTDETPQSFKVEPIPVLDSAEFIFSIDDYERGHAVP